MTLIDSSSDVRVTNSGMDYHSLNAMLNLYDKDGQIQFGKDKEAARDYIINNINANLVSYDSLEEKLESLFTEGYYEREVFDQYDFNSGVKALYKHVYSKKFRFPTYFGAFTFYNAYALKTKDGRRYLERFEDRVAATALYLARGDLKDAYLFADKIMSLEYQPATPTFLNAAKKARGELVSCFLVRDEDNMESIARGTNAVLQLSKRGGGIAVCLTNLREAGAPIKGVQGQSSGIIPVAKIIEDAVTYSNQLGQRDGSAAVYLSVHHPDVETLIDSKRENANERIRLNRLSIGLVFTDVVMEKFRKGETFYTFSPYDVQREYGKAMSDISINDEYANLMANPNIKKKAIDARKFMRQVAEVQFDSGYPYFMFEDTVNAQHNLAGRVSMSNLCVAPETKILTDKGQIEIGTLEGQTVNVWNGEKFSETQVVKTGDSQELLHVSLNNGAQIDATPYHKWYVQRGYSRGSGTNKLKTEELRTSELQAGDRLIKFDLPVLESTGPDLPYAYTAGFHTADGTYGGTRRDVPKVYLYGDKKYLLPHLDVLSGSGLPDSTGRLTYLLPTDIAPKFAVPHENSVSSKLEWLAGLIDGDGTGSGSSRTGVQIASNRPGFLDEIRLMLQTMGINSRVNVGNKGGMTVFHPGQKAYETQDMFRLLIAGSETQKLIMLGLETHRVVLKPQKLDRAATHFVKVVSVENNGRIDDTYCFTEPDRSMGMFNGVLTGNCSEILQRSTESTYDEDLSYEKMGTDISCNLGSLNIANVIRGGDLPRTVSAGIRMLTAVSDLSNIRSVPSVAKGNDDTHAIGLGQMNLHGFLASESIMYDSPEAIDFTSSYFATVAFYAVSESNKIAKDRKEKFGGFENSKYASGEYFDKYTTREWSPETEEIKALFVKYAFEVPTSGDWAKLKKSVQKYGMYNGYLQAVPPTGSISYVNYATASIHPIVAQVEARSAGKTGRAYVPSFGLTNDNREYYKDAYEIGARPIIDLYAAATIHVDQGLSCTLFFTDEASTVTLNKAQSYAHSKGLKTLYYMRFRQKSIDGLDPSECVNCAL